MTNTLVITHQSIHEGTALVALMAPELNNVVLEMKFSTYGLWGHTQTIVLAHVPDFRNLLL
jgi:hypothetical protein